MADNLDIIQQTASLIEKMPLVISSELHSKISKMGGWRTRFAPSPTGLLHVGHAYAAYVVWQIAGSNPDKFLLRIDDLDYTRSSQTFIQQIKNDLNWLDIYWREPEIYQSERLVRYKNALEILQQEGLIYPCYLSRTEISEFLSPPESGLSKQPHTRNLLSDSQINTRQKHGIKPAYRLDMSKAINSVGDVFWQNIDGQVNKAVPEKFGDIILGRRDITASYHLSVVLDDADSNIEVVTRGNDLKQSTDIHCLLQKLLGLPSPSYFHHPLVIGKDGTKLSKTHKSVPLSIFKDSEISIKNIIKETFNQKT